MDTVVNLSKIPDYDDEDTCSFCCSKRHATADHPSPISPQACAYCWRGECIEGGPCDKAATLCACSCVGRGRGT